MLHAHFAQIEEELLKVAQRLSTSGHPLNKGIAREIFLKNYLEDHLSSLLAAGTGELIDAHSLPNEPRPQIDIVIYKRQFPKIHFGGGIDAFFVESVVATIEVKSCLTKKELRNAMRAALKLKALQRDETSTWTIGPGYKQPGLLSFLVAYDGPAKMKTVREWMRDIDGEFKVQYEELGSTIDERQTRVSPVFDGIFVLGKGFVAYDTLPLTVVSDVKRAQHPKAQWSSVNMPRGGLLYLFCVVTIAACGLTFHGFNALAYLKNVRLDARNLLFD